MTQNFKPIINNLKQKWENREEFRQQVIAGLNMTKSLVEYKAREVATQAKSHKLVTDVIRPAVGSPTADQLVEKLQATLKHPLAARVGDLRNQFLEFTKFEEETTEPTTEDTEPVFEASTTEVTETVVVTEPENEDEVTLEAGAENETLPKPKAKKTTKKKAAKKATTAE